MTDNPSAKKIYGLIGYPVKHSLSPAMHNAAFQALNINAEYKLFELKPEELEGFLSGVKKNNIFGLNVTVPYKEKVMPFLDNLSEEAKLIGAVNTIKCSGEKLEGFNTDGAGFLEHLIQDLKFDPAGKDIAIIGAGGAARAVSVSLSKKGPKGIAIYDIDKSKLSALISHLQENFKGIDFIAAPSVAQLNLKNVDLLVNATPIGMKESDPCPIEDIPLSGGLLVYDLIYNPQETKLLKIARAGGSCVANGLGMLLYQGVESFEFWTGQKAPVEVMRQALSEAINK
ncbi:MAG: shikimate dehydrogenase [Candidatus Omnitrophica bacterium]|nr:shikimate dehydrogenase [Candidatus Omnitrophota bacterium]MDD5592904.1 shikimate dehydrogenase [Candidatus Omnitrophota bacterium]